MLTYNKKTYILSSVLMVRSYSSHHGPLQRETCIKTLVLFMGMLALSFTRPLRAIKWELHDPPWAEIGNVAVNASCYLGRLGQGEASAFPGRRCQIKTLQCCVRQFPHCTFPFQKLLNCAGGGGWCGFSHKGDQGCHLKEHYLHSVPALCLM